MIAIIDYDAGNMRSVEKALIALGEKPVITRQRDILLKADKVILPGVGAYADCMNKLSEYKLITVIQEIVAKEIPFLGICLGMQLMFESSEENMLPDSDKVVKGLGLLKGRIIKIPDTGLKIPHMGWNSLDIKPGTKLFRGIEDGSYVYFVHSYYLKADDIDIVSATTKYGCTIHAAVEYRNLFGCQFHPEKSSDVGQMILKNFIDL